MAVIEHPSESSGFLISDFVHNWFPQSMPAAIKRTTPTIRKYGQKPPFYTYQYYNDVPRLKPCTSYLRIHNVRRSENHIRQGPRVRTHRSRPFRADCIVVVRLLLFPLTLNPRLLRFFHRLEPRTDLSGRFSFARQKRWVVGRSA